MILDRTRPPESHLLEKLTVEFPDELNLSGVPTITVLDDTNPIVFLELTLGNGKYDEIVGGESYFASKMLSEGTRYKSSEEISEAFQNEGSFYEITPTLEYVSVRIYSLRKNFQKTLSLVEELLTKSVFKEEAFGRIKAIRTNQLKNRLAQPSQLATLKFNELCFGQDHPIGKIITPDVVSDIQLHEVETFFSNYFFNNAKAILSGDFNQSDLRSLESFLGRMPLIIRGTDKTPAKSDFGHHELSSEDGTQASIRIGGRGVGFSHQDYYPLRITNTLFGGYFGSRLMKNIREDLGLTYGIHSGLLNVGSDNFWMINAELNKENLEKARIEITKELEILASSPPGPKELAKVQNYIRGKMMMDMSSIYGRTNAFKSVFLKELNWEFITEYLDTINDIKPGTISEMVSKYFMSSDRITLVIR